MDECIVALKSAKLLRGAMERARRGQENRGLAEPTIRRSSGITPVMSNTRSTRHAVFEDSSNMAVDGGIDGSGAYQATLDQAAHAVSGLSPLTDPGLLLNHYWGPVNFLDMDNAMVMDFCFQFDELNSAHSAAFDM
ncbi:hypothetical protein CC79DRAFT_157451 [Sarocladium strictum]